MDVTEKTATTKYTDGYDIPLYGLDDGTFYYIHIPAVICIVISFICAVISIVWSCRRNKCRSFFHTWTKSERFVVYMAACDGLFNVSHFMDHTHILLTEEMVRPKQLCQWYGFNLVVFITAQHLMVNLVAFNAFMLIYFNRNLNFGKYDWKLLTWIFGIPLLGATIAAAFGELGPNGTYCYFDGVKGNVANMLFTTGTLSFVFATNTVLYTFTWIRIKDQDRKIKRFKGNREFNASKQVARSFLLFVFAFFIQWWASFVFGLWGLVEATVPQAIFNLMVVFANLGGVFNLIVCILIRKRGQRSRKVIRDINYNQSGKKSQTIAKISGGCVPNQN